VKRLTCSALLLTAWLSGCGSVGPDYQKPDMATPQAWKPEAGWQASAPQDDQAKGPWWLVYHDDTLNALETQALTQNQNLLQAQTRLTQARAQTSVALSSLLPQVGLQAGTSRFQTSQDRPLAAYSVPNQTVKQNDYNAALTVSYEVDLSGRVDRRIEAAKAAQAQSGADFENTRLILCAQLAANYFSLRQLDADVVLLGDVLKSQQKAFALVTTRHESGSASGLDLENSRVQVANTRAQLESLIDQRAHFEHAIATLVGQDAPSFALAPRDNPLQWVELPLVSPAQPSQLLERRPDIASAERAMASANAQIGIAKSAYFPTVNFATLLGQDSNRASLLWNGPSTLWSVGLSATQTVFDAGRTQAGVQMAQASYQQAVANYRQTVLNAFQEVQDSLSSQAHLHLAQASVREGEQSNARILALTEVRFAQGAANPLDLLQAQQNWLSYKRLLYQTHTQELLNSVQLVKALGGGWQIGQANAQ
jgi:outer membrane protein, multidrug efflux system